MEQLKQYLIKEGFDIEMMGGRCPFQIEANHSSGISIYFRCRGQSASLEVFNCHYNGIDGLPDDDDCLWFDKFQSWEPYQAGYLSWNDSFYAFYALWNDAKNYLN